MRVPTRLATLTLVLLCSAFPSAAPQKPAPAPRLEPVDARLQALKQQAIADVDGMRDLTQQMIDQVFSFGELGFQEHETSRYLTGVLRKNGFTITEGVAGIPTAWFASWGSGKPVIALGSDIDGLPQTNQKPGVPWREPLVEGAPGHGEGHNSGVPMNITAALAVKRIMEREKLGGTIIVWPGVAEELVAAKAFYVRDGLFKNVDVVLFSHVSSSMGTSWGAASGNGLVSVEYAFTGQSAHSAGMPWRGRSALDAVELMNVGWNFRREHLRLQQRSHYVITDGGDQPNVVPSTASVWYYFRETEYPRIKQMWDIGNRMAEAAAMMTDTTVTSRVLGAAWPQHFNKVLAEAAQANMKAVGMPKWDEADQALAKAVQREMKQNERGLESEVGKLGEPVRDEDNRGGGSDDIGDVSWVAPTITLRYPANIPGTIGHHWSSGIAMATPIAHKGCTAGAKVHALTMLDLLLKPALVTQAWEYYTNVQTKDQKYTPLVRPEDKPATFLNTKIMAEYREKMKPFYFDPSRYKTYLEQLGVPYPPPVKPAGK
ncbi:MAG: amidohydrolase [Vicinamibacterales bacterium]|jgi:aminobenzoyl-glutamate utilization protein B|nr:amidohydrolase [Vicinamibacterales bacterium]